jgi:hypothetical protein
MLDRHVAALLAMTNSVSLRVQRVYANSLSLRAQRGNPWRTLHHMMTDHLPDRASLDRHVAALLAMTDSVSLRVQSVYANSLSLRA